MNENQPQYRISPAAKTDDEEILIGPLWTNLKGTFWYVLKRWYILLLFIAIFSALAMVYVMWYGTKYIATTSFAVGGETAASGLLSSSLSIANQLGLQGTPGKNTTYNNNFFASLIQSRKVIKESLMDSAMMDGEKDLLANHYINLYHWRTGSIIRKGWNKIPKLRNFYFHEKPLKQLTSLEDSIMNVIYENIIENNLVVTYDATTPFNIATFNTRSRDFSMWMMKYMVDKSASYYLDNVYQLNRKNMGIADQRVDSLARVLKNLDYRVANLKDQSNNTIRQKGLLDVNSAKRQQDLLSTQYSAAVNNVELAKVTILTTAPILQVVDDPVFSTEVSFVRWYFALIVAAIIGIFFGTIYLVIARAVKKSNDKVKERKQLEEQQNSGTVAA